ncbi:DNA repair protein crb2 [Neolecta irregularis DAH-3]|uniref:DNA repair protein crb2 n=1 Tax=Neolecta irregularis (strain DAH-3) TaxID=1198029 RepID=A0A1U7LUJ9_NEOID|nr:DNA repair protein crb2 [Neolecta irregularis DAH-3]|eukprot:OLL26350.1 DNA repair protein crb2 [Neolecta irregularis DAH-3]
MMDPQELLKNSQIIEDDNQIRKFAISRQSHDQSKKETTQYTDEVPESVLSERIRQSPQQHLSTSQSSPASLRKSKDQNNDSFSQSDHDEEGLSQLRVASISTNDKFGPIGQSTARASWGSLDPMNQQHSSFKPPSPILCAGATQEFETPYGCSKTSQNLRLSQFFQDSPEAESSPLPQSVKMKPSRSLVELQGSYSHKTSGRHQDVAEKASNIRVASTSLPRTRKRKHRTNHVDRLRAFDELRKPIVLPTSDNEPFLEDNEFGKHPQLGRCRSANVDTNLAQGMDEEDDLPERPFSSAPLQSNYGYENQTPDSLLVNSLKGDSPGLPLLLPPQPASDSKSPAPYPSPIQYELGTQVDQKTGLSNAQYTADAGFRITTRSEERKMSFAIKGSSPESQDTMATPFMRREVEIPGTVFETSPIYKATQLADKTPSRVLSPKYGNGVSYPSSELPYKPVVLSRFRQRSTRSQSPTLEHQNTLSTTANVVLKRKQLTDNPPSVIESQENEVSPSSEIRRLKKFRTAGITVVQDSQNKNTTPISADTKSRKQQGMALPMLSIVMENTNSLVKSRSRSVSETSDRATSVSSAAAAQGLKQCNRVFALFKGHPAYYYPARVVSPVALWSKTEAKQLRVRFDDTFETTLDRLHIKRFELHPGDVVKVDEQGCRKTTFVVEKVENHRSLKAKRKDTGILTDVPLEKLYLTPSMFDKLSDRTFPALGVDSWTCKSEDSDRETPARQFITTRSSVPRATSTPPNSQVNLEPISKLFGSIAFAITLSPHADHIRHDLRQSIELHSGIVLDSGFEELFFKHKDFVKHSGQGQGVMSILTEYRNLKFACVIADSHCRKVKYLQALAFGLPCLSVRFVEDCVSHNEVIDFGPYLLPAGESEYLGCVKSMTVKPIQLSFGVCLTDRKGLLSGMSVAVMTSKNKDEGRKTYLFLARAMGADISFRITEFDASQIMRAKMNQPASLLVLVSPDELRRAEGAFGRYSRVVTLEWIVQSLILGKLLQ